MNTRLDTRNLLTIVLTASLVFMTMRTASATATSFVEPGSWSVGDANTTYNEWDGWSELSGNPPSSSTVNPAITSTPTLAAVDTNLFVPGGPIVSGGANFYSFSQDYGIAADIYNHGGSLGSGGLPAGSGTHVIVQTSSTLNPDFDAGVSSETFELVDLLGNPIAGGDYPSVLRHDILFDGTAIGPMGPVTQREEIWEFFLPNYVDDFRIQAEVVIHSSFDHLRVDTAIGASAFATTAIPEPASLLLLAGAAAVTLGGRHYRRA